MNVIHSVEATTQDTAPVDESTSHLGRLASRVENVVTAILGFIKDTFFTFVDYIPLVGRTNKARPDLVDDPSSPTKIGSSTSAGANAAFDELKELEKNFIDKANCTLCFLKKDRVWSAENAAKNLIGHLNEARELLDRVANDNKKEAKEIVDKLSNILMITKERIKKSLINPPGSVQSSDLNFQIHSVGCARLKVRVQGGS